MYLIIWFEFLLIRFHVADYQNQSGCNLDMLKSDLDWQSGLEVHCVRVKTLQVTLCVLKMSLNIYDIMI